MEDQFDLFCPLPVPASLTTEECTGVNLLQQLSELKALATEKGLMVFQQPSLLSSVAKPVMPQLSGVGSRVLVQACGQFNNFQFRIVLISCLPETLFKDRSFGLLAQLTDLEGNYVTLPSPEQFLIELYSTDHKPLLVKRLKARAQARSAIYFRKVVLNVVSSHYRLRSLVMVVRAANYSRVMPLVLEDIVVRSRTKALGSPRKKPKCADK